MKRLSNSKKTLAILGAVLLMIVASSTALARFDPGEDRLPPTVEHRNDHSSTPTTTASPLPTPTAELRHEVEFTGAVEVMASDQWVIGGRTVMVTAATEIKSGIEIGTQVKVHARVQADGSLSAREIEPLEHEDNGNVNSNDDHGNDNHNDNGNVNTNDDHGNDNHNDNGNVNANDDHGNDNHNDNSNVNSNDNNGNDNHNDNGNVNTNDDHGNDNRNDNGNVNANDDHGNDNHNDNSDVSSNDNSGNDNHGGNGNVNTNDDHGNSNDDHGSKGSGG